VYEFLKENNYVVCFGEEDFRPGCVLVKAIADAVSKSRKVVAVISPNYVESGWTELEVVFCLTQIGEKNAPLDSFIPVIYKKCEMRPELQSFKYIDYTTLCNNSSQPTFCERVLAFVTRKKTCHQPNDEGKFHSALLKSLGKPSIRRKRRR
jgi:hypothetical protein